MSYVDGFLLPVPKKNLKKYKKLAVMAGKVWMKHGALAYMECIGDELKPSFGAQFPKLMKLKPSETVLFSFIIYKSKAHRNKVNAKVMKDPAMQCAPDPKKLPFDCSKMYYGGFNVLVDA